MAEQAKKAEISKAPRDRSPAFPFIPLKVALDRLVEFDKNFGRHPTPVGKAGLAWGMKEGGSQTVQTLAALKYFGLMEYEGSGTNRKASISEDGRNYLRAQQDEIKKSLLKKFALKPKEIAKFWNLWKADRPHDAVCLDALVIDNDYNEKYAPRFLKVYDETTAFAGLTASDKIEATDEEAGDEIDEENIKEYPVDKFTKSPLTFPPIKKGLPLMEGERELQGGMLSQNATFRVIVSGQIGLKEIEHLIKRLELDKEILAIPVEQSEGENSAN